MPHLYLNREPPEEILSYLESLTDDSAATSGLSISSASASSRAIKQEVVQDMLKPAKPSILQRKRKQKVDEIEENPRLLQVRYYVILSKNIKFSNLFFALYFARDSFCLALSSHTTEVISGTDFKVRLRILLPIYFYSLSNIQAR